MASCIFFFFYLNSFLFSTFRGKAVSFVASHNIVFRKFFNFSPKHSFQSFILQYEKRGTIRPLLQN